MESFSVFDISAVEPEFHLQLPTEVWSNAWTWSGDSDACTEEVELPTGGMYGGADEMQWKGSPAESTAHSFNSEPSLSDSFGQSFDSSDSLAQSFSYPPIAPSEQQKERKPRKKSSPFPIGQVEEKDLDYKKYKTRLCRNWQQTGKCPYGDSCVYAHGSKEVRGEQENEAVVNSLAKLAEQMMKHMAVSKAGTPAAPLRPLRYRKPKATKSASSGFDERAQGAGPVAAPASAALYLPPYYGQVWVQA